MADDKANIISFSYRWKLLLVGLLVQLCDEQLNFIKLQKTVLSRNVPVGNKLVSLGIAASTRIEKASHQMLSSENDLPDPQKSTVQFQTSDENVTKDHYNPLSEEEHQLNPSSAHVHNFSIRDFVLAARTKDIVTNWPFHDKHLKLCLRHGVKDLLPPFQSKTYLGKQFSADGLEKTGWVDDEIVTRIPDEVPSIIADCHKVCPLDDDPRKQKITGGRLDINFDQSDKDSDFLSSVVSNSQVHQSRTDGISKHAKYAKKSAKLSAKKCKLIVKFGYPSVNSSNNNIMTHKSNLPESLASKVCPVCKTFSSSSNTTLNAHIDQCLAVESTSDGMIDSKIGTKYKVKPRKMRSMVDIYAAALVYTIEDLDKRNGTSWATDLTLPTLNDGMTYVQGNKKQTHLPAEPNKEVSDDGGVYIDANGRKLRILSKMNSFSSMLTVKEDGSGKQTGVNNRLSSGKKKYYGAKYKGYHRHAVSHEKLFSPKANMSEVQRNLKHPHEALLSIDRKCSQSEGVRQTDRPGNFKAVENNQQPRHEAHAVAKIKKSNLGSSFIERCSSKDLPRQSMCGNPKRLRSSNHISMLHSVGVIRTRLSVSEDDVDASMDANDPKQTKGSVDSNSAGVHMDKSSTCKTLKLTSGQVKQIDDNESRPIENRVSNSYPSLQTPAKFSRNNNFTRSRLSVSDKVEGQKVSDKVICCTNEEDRQLLEVEQDDDEDEDQYETEDDEEDRGQSDTHVLYDSMLEHTGKWPVTFKKGIDRFEPEEKAMSESAEAGALNLTDNASEKLVDNPEVSLSSRKEVEQGRSDIVFDPRSTVSADRHMGDFIRSMNSGIHGRADTYDYQSISSEANGTSSRPKSAACPPNPILERGVCKYTIMELETEVGHTISETDPILIPGPPGSFLSSPGEVESEDYQVNSSMTASLISSYEQHIARGNSLESPNSSASSISNSIAEAPEKVAEKLPSIETHAPVLPIVTKNSELQIECGSKKRYVKLQDDGQSCCCSRKERISRGSTVEYQESQLLRRRTMSAAVLPVKEKMSCSLNTGPSYSYAVSDPYPLSNSSNIEVETVGDPCGGFASPKTNVAKFFNNGESESAASPSAVLRLMGKNLMVAKNDEDSSDQSKHVAPSHADSQILNRAAASPSNNLGRGGYYYPQYEQRAVPCDLPMVSSEYSSMQQSFDSRVPNGYRWGQIGSLRHQQQGSVNVAEASRLADIQHMYNRISAAPLDHQWSMQQRRILNGFDVVHGESQKVMTACDMNFRKDDILMMYPNDDNTSDSGFTVGAAKSNGLRGTCCVSVAPNEQEQQSRLVYSAYYHHHPVFGGHALPVSPPIMYMQQPKNTCSGYPPPPPVPYSGRVIMNHPHQVKYYAGNGGDAYMMKQQQQQPSGSSFVASSLGAAASHSLPGDFFSTRLP